MGKVAVDVSPANPDRLYANIEAKGEKGWVYRSDNAVPHVDQHELWINPTNPQNMILSNDGGGCISFYGGQQDNTSISIASKTIFGGIGVHDWYSVAGGESAFLAFKNPSSPVLTYGTSIQGTIDAHNKNTGMNKDIMAYPSINLGSIPLDQKYRFNWNGPLVHNQLNPRRVLDESGQLIRSYSNQKDKNYKSWVGAPPPARLLTAKPGLNRSYWDLSRETLPSVEGVYVLGSLTGSMVGPGTYTLQMTLDGNTVKQKVEVLPDPRLEATPEDWALQQEMLISAETAIREIHQSVSNMRIVRDQLNAHLELLKDKEESDDLLSEWNQYNQQLRGILETEVADFNRMHAALNYPALIVPGGE